MKQQGTTGFVLVTALIFLVVLTLVAVTAVKGTGLEMRMSSNNAEHIEAFESSEAPREITGRLLAALGDNGGSGWPASVQGPVANSVFSYTIPAGFEIHDASGAKGGTPLNWFEIPAASFDNNTFTSRARYEQTVGLSNSSAFKLTADIDVQVMGTKPVAGCDLADMSKNCLNTFFLVRSRGTDPTGVAISQTASVYRFTPKN